MLINEVSGSRVGRHSFRAFAEADKRLCFNCGLSDGKCQMSELQYKIEKKFAVNKVLISFWVKYLLINLIASSADLAFLIEFETCWAHFSCESKVTPNTLIVGELFRVMPFKIKSIGRVMVL